MAPRLPALLPLFQPIPTGPTAALVVAGACGNVGFGKLGQLARLLVPHGIPVVALDVSPKVTEIRDRLREAFGERFAKAEVDAVLEGITVVHGGIADLPADLRVGFVFEAIPERLALKHGFYAAVHARDPDAYVFSATSGFPSRTLFEGLAGAGRCGVLHPFYPHLTNKLWEMADAGATTGEAEKKVVRRFLGAIGMTPIAVADVPAFAADRIFCGMMLEAVRIHVDTGLSPAQIDDVCRESFGTAPFFVHNLIAGANYLSAHCIELLGAEVDSSLFAIPEAWRPYVADPTKQWPYERGQRCPPDRVELVRDRMLGMTISLTAYMAEHRVVALDALNFLCENALAFREGTPALIQGMGFSAARARVERFLSEQRITAADRVAPLSALDPERPGWYGLYVATSRHGEVGLLSLKRTTLSHGFFDELDRAIDRLQADPAVRAIVIAPDGVYSRELGHGADLQCFVPVLGDATAAAALIERWKRTLAKLRGEKPTVAALVGRVLGGSLELASWCHARIAAEKTRLQFPETTVGVIPGLGGCHHLHRSSDPQSFARIDELLLTGHGFTAEEAQRWGFVGEVVPVAELPARSLALAAELATGTRPVPAFRMGPLAVRVDRGVGGRNEAGVALDADLRELLASAIEGANARDFAEGSAFEQQAAAVSLAAPAAAVGVKAMLRGKAPEFPRPLP